MAIPHMTLWVRWAKRSSSILYIISARPVLVLSISYTTRDRRGRDCMVVRFTTTYAISAYHHWCCEFESRSGRGVQHYVIKFVSDLWQVGGFLWVLRFPPPITDRHDITEKLLKVVLKHHQTNKLILTTVIETREC